MVTNPLTALNLMQSLIDSHIKPQLMVKIVLQSHVLSKCYQDICVIVLASWDNNFIIWIKGTSGLIYTGA